MTAELRWFTRDNGERVLQIRSAFGWEDVPEVSEASERSERREAEEQFQLEQERRNRRLVLESLPYHHRKAFKDFYPE